MIIHKLIKKERSLRYLCNQAVSITDIKGRFYWNKVNCKNCLRLKPSDNNDFKKPCPRCGGKGEVKSAVRGLDGYDLEDCPDCEGHDS